MFRYFFSRISFVSFSLACSFCFSDDTSLRVCFWNVESGGAKTSNNASRIEDEQEVDIWGLSEVKNSSDATKYQLAAREGESGDFTSILGTTGGQDRLQIIFNSDKLELVENSELHDLNVGGSVRAPLVARFKLRGTDQEFLFVVNHLYRSNDQHRHTQARKLNDWAEEQTAPAIIGGDMNFDWHYQTGSVNHDAGFDYLVEDGVCHWVMPDTLVPTQSSRYKSVLDFVFVSGTAITWPAKSTILVKPGDFPDGSTRSDHRPVDCVFIIPDHIVTPLAPEVVTFAEAVDVADVASSEPESLNIRSSDRSADLSFDAMLILKRIERLQLELEALKEMLKGSTIDRD